VNNKDFAHLHLHSEHSHLDGYGSSQKYIKEAKDLGFQYIGLTNHGNIDGLLQWQKECEKQNINHVLGCEAYIVPDRHIKQKEKKGHISLFVANEDGWKTLCSLLTEANLSGFYYSPRIDYNLLLNSDLSGLIISTACSGSFLNLPGAEDLLKELDKKTDVYFEIMPHNIPSQKDIHSKIKKLAKKYKNIPFIATNDCHYTKEDEWESQDMLLAINRRAKWKDPARWSFGFKGLHLRTAGEMLQAFEDQKDWSKDTAIQAMKNTIKIAEQCSKFKLSEKEISLPKPPGIQKQSEKKVLGDLCTQGYLKIFGTEVFSAEYQKRYSQELKLITEKKFERYFLIVHDLIDWSRKKGIMVGPGRGSVGGSLIAYLLGITQVDPIVFGLSFSRFISEDRGDWPDIDIDFEKRYRKEVILRIKEVYGKNNTCGISTVMRMQSRAAIRDVCRVMEVSQKDTNFFANSIRKGEHIEGSAIQSSIDNTEEGRYFAAKYPKVVRLILKMEGQIRGAGAHAAAVVVSKEDLTTAGKCVLVKRNDRIVCNWDMEDSEYMGLMKLDILGLSTLSVLSECRRLINDDCSSTGLFQDPVTGRYLILKIMEVEFEEKYKDYKQIEFSFDKIPIEDKETFDKITSGKTSGMFQLSGRSCTELCKKMEIHSFMDIVAGIALARPGPTDSGMTEEYVKRKHGQKWKPLHPIYEEVTKETYGLLVYQEQVMQVISRVAGLSESIADKIRKVIGKKRDPKEFKPFWEQFSQGCRKMKTFSQKEAEEFWEGLLKWSSYGFNKSHATAYALIAYQTAYLKTHYEKEFFAASLTYGEWNEKATDPNKHKNSLLSEVRQQGYMIITPKRNFSNAKEWRFIGGTLYIPFIEINGIGENNASKCLEPVRKNRLQGFFKSQVVKETSNTRFDEILLDLCVDEIDAILPVSVLSKYFPHIDLQGSKIEKYSQLVELFEENISLKDLPDFASLNLESSEIPDNLIKRKRFRVEDKVFRCNNCDLRKYVKNRAILSSLGVYNAIILLGFPGRIEDEEKKGGVGRAGDLLWKELKKYGYSRRFFHITHCCRCWPSQTKKPTHFEIDSCHRWLHEESRKIQSRIILACGDTALYSLTGRKEGILEMSGETEWVESIGAWCCWCVDPSFVLKSKKDNSIPFQKGIENFVNKVSLLEKRK